MRHLDQVVWVDGRLLAGWTSGGRLSVGGGRSILRDFHNVGLGPEARAMDVRAHEDASVASIAMWSPGKLDYGCLRGVAVRAASPDGRRMLLLKGRPDLCLHQRVVFGALLLLLMGAELGREAVHRAVRGVAALVGAPRGVVDLTDAAHGLFERAEGPPSNVGYCRRHKHAREKRQDDDYSRAPVEIEKTEAPLLDILILDGLCVAGLNALLAVRRRTAHDQGEEEVANERKDGKCEKYDALFKPNGGEELQDVEVVDGGKSGGGAVGFTSGEREREGNPRCPLCEVGEVADAEVASAGRGRRNRRLRT